MITIHELRQYDDALLALIEEHMPAWREDIAKVRQSRAAEQQRWNSATLLAAHYRAWVDWRWEAGYSANEEARGVDEQESDAWEQARKRIRFLRKRSLRRLNRRHRSRSRM